MFNEGFYPTPVEVIDRLLEPIVKKAAVYSDRPDYLYIPHKKILEPSAGKGDIADRLVDKYHVERKNISCIEIEPELRAILTQKQYTVVSDDFLHFSDPYIIDLIVMNPPFADGDSHLLHAWNTLTYGDIACILNAETIRNTYSRERKLLKDIIEQHGYYVEVGSIFSDAERQTDVECVFVYLHKDKPDVFQADFEGLGLDQDRAYEDDSDGSPKFLSNPDVLDSLVDQYNAAVKLSLERIKIERQLSLLLNDVRSVNVKPADRDQQKEVTSILSNKENDINKEITGLKSLFWNYVFTRTRLGKITTSQYQKQFSELLEGTRNLSFNRRNIMAVLNHFLDNRERIFYDCINEVFDLATAFHEKNRIHVEGWKTNKNYRVAPKIIMPKGIYYDKKFNSWDIGSYNEHFYRDIDKALCFITGKNIEEIKTLYSAMYDATSYQSGWRYPDPFRSEFFEVRLFKKGTVHLTFLDKDVLDRFNIAAANGRMWLGQ